MYDGCTCTDNTHFWVIYHLQGLIKGWASDIGNAENTNT